MARAAEAPLLAPPRTTALSEDLQRPGVRRGRPTETSRGPLDYPLHYSSVHRAARADLVSALNLTKLGARSHRLLQVLEYTPHGGREGQSVSWHLGRLLGG